MTKIKLCGLSRPEDIQAANALQPACVGFVFAPKSKRYVTPAQAADLKKGLDPAIRAVGVFVNAPPEEAAALANEGVIDLIQLHGGEGEAYLQALRALTPKPILQAFRVDTAADVAAAEASGADLVLLDVMLPKLDGFTVLRRLRAEGSTTPVLMLTARSELTDRVNGLDSGADYYLTKPFEPKELLACIRALTRRQPELRQTDALKYGDLRLEKTSFTLSCGERSVRLSRKEFDMMEMLMLNQKLVITKEKLLLKVWGYESDAEDNNVEVYISFLRKKLDHLHSQVKIRTIRMVGYCLEAPEEA